nr:MAG TPA: hypothetical protein [Bacteriophage sp.]
MVIKKEYYSLLHLRSREYFSISCLILCKVTTILHPLH